MFCIELHNGIHKIIEGYNRLGIWHGREEASVKQKGMKIIYFIIYSTLPISLIAGAIASENKNESIMLVEIAIISINLLMRLFYMLWRQKDVHELLNRIGVHSIEDKEDFDDVDKKLNSFMKWISYFYTYALMIGVCATLGIPLIGRGKELFLNIGFPLDYKNNYFAYSAAVLFLCTEGFLSLISISFSIIMWYLLLNCGLKYKVLGSELQKIGVIKTVDAAVKKRKISDVEKQNSFKRDLIGGIKSHKHINEITRQLETFLSELFSIQLATSAGCICASVYTLAFVSFYFILETVTNLYLQDHNVSIMEYQIYVAYLVYNICDIFMVMYLGNEILLSSDGLSYCLFQSNWIDQTQSCKLILIIFGERLKKAQQLLILKLYPMTLETFTRVLNGAYSMFNILKTLALKH